MKQTNINVSQGLLFIVALTLFVHQNSQASAVSVTQSNAVLPRHTATITNVPLRTVLVATANDFRKSLTNAQAGDNIVLAEGSTIVGVFTTGQVNGTVENPITIQSANPSNPSTIMSTGGGNVLAVTGNYWLVQNVKLTGGQKGFVFDHAHNSEIIDCEISNTAMEGLHFRNGSQNCTADGCYIHDTGKQSPGYGEGIYVGSDVSSWSQYSPAVFNSTIINCTVGPNISAECVDIKEGTTGTVIDSCTFYGVGMGDFSTMPPRIANSADSFIDIKCPDITGNRKGIDGNSGVSNDVQITRCTFNRFYNPITGQEGNSNSTCCAEGVQLHYKALTDAQRAMLNSANYNNAVAEITDNIFDMSNISAAQQIKDYIVDASSSSGYHTLASAYNNTRIPQGSMYYGSVGEEMLIGHYIRKLFFRHHASHKNKTKVPVKPLHQVAVVLVR